MNKWRVTTIGACSTILGDGLHGTPKYTSNGEYAFINGNNLRDGKIVIKADTKRVDEDEYKKYKKDLNERTVLVSINGTLGNVAIYNGEKVILGKSACYFNVVESCDVTFMKYVVSSPQFQQYLQSVATGTTIKNVSLKQMREYEFLIPDLEIQQKIAATLKNLDDKIALNNKINDNLEQQALELFSNYQKASDGKIGFTDVIQILGGGTPKTKESAYWNGDIPFFTPKDVGCPYTILTEKTITEDGLNHCNSQLYPVNTVFVTARGTVGKVCMPGVSMAMNQSCYALVGKNLHQLMVYFYTLATVERLKHKASGAVFDAITTKDFSSEYINRLSEQDEKSFLKIVEPMFQMMLSNIIENKKLENMRDMLLPKLMSGEIKLD